MSPDFSAKLGVAESITDLARGAFSRCGNGFLFAGSLQPRPSRRGSEKLSIGFHRTLMSAATFWIPPLFLSKTRLAPTETNDCLIALRVSRRDDGKSSRFATPVTRRATTMAVQQTRFRN